MERGGETEREREKVTGETKRGRGGRDRLRDTGGMKERERGTLKEIVCLSPTPHAQGP